ncbi:MAG TPA: hypothetical protein VHE61_13085 [Opitutaceae bacterium]|nr:hypothetical protein [Opitutaceae bacterium]
MRVRSRLFPHAIGVLMALVLAVAARAEVRFSKALSPAQWVAAGYIHLGTPQANALDALIQKDIDSARQGDVPAFAKSFTERRTPEERLRAGIDTLTPSERTVLNELVAAAIAGRPASPAVTAAIAHTPAAQAVKIDKPRMQVHGSVTFVVGAGSHGTSWYGGGFNAYMTDPTHHFTLSVGMSEIRGKGWGWSGCDDGLPW